MEKSGYHAFNFYKVAIFSLFFINFVPELPIASRKRVIIIQYKTN